LPKENKDCIWEAGMTVPLHGVHDENYARFKKEFTKNLIEVLNLDVVHILNSAPEN